MEDPLVPEDAAPAEPPRPAFWPPAMMATLGELNWRAVLPLAAALALGLGTLSVIPLLARPLELLIVAITVAEALSPAVTRFHRRMNRGLAIALVYALVVSLGLVVVWLTVPPLIAQGQELVSRIPGLLAQAQAWVDHWDRLTGGRAGQALAAAPERVASMAVKVPFQLAASLFDLLVILFLSVYWLAGVGRIKRFTLSLLPPRNRERAAGVMERMGHAMGGYVRGTAINAAIMGVLAWIGLFFIGVPYAVVLGVLTMAGELVPIVGPVVVGAIVALIALLRSPTLALLAVALYTALIQLEGHVLTPNIMRSQTRVPQTLVLFAIVVGGGVGGLLGVIVAIPIAGALRVFVLEVVAPAERRLAGAVPPPIERPAP